MSVASKEEVCCPRFDPRPWDGKKFVWKGKPFIKDKVYCLFYMPLGFGRVVSRDLTLIASSGSSDKDRMMLCDHKSPWSMDLFISVKKDVPGAKNEDISGTFLSKVFEGPFKDAKKWADQMDAYVRGKGKVPKRTLFWYTTCPKCAKKYGKNYSVLFSEI